MKKRIIAALTAIVMVVTMIPSTAFGQGFTPAQVTGLIYQATAQSTGNDFNVPYTDAGKKAIEDAKVAYASLDLAGKAEVNASQENVKKYVGLLAAEAIYNYYGEAIAEYNTALKGFKKGILKVENDLTIVNGNKIVTPELYAIKKATKNVSDGATVDVYVINGDNPETLVVEAGEKDIPEKFKGEDAVGITGVKSGEILKDCLDKKHLDAEALNAKTEITKYYGAEIVDLEASFDAEKKVIDAIVAVNKITQETVANLVKNPVEGSKEEAAKRLVLDAETAIEAADGSSKKELITYAKNYSIYLTAMEKLKGFEMPEKVKEEISIAATALKGEWKAQYSNVLTESPVGQPDQQLVNVAEAPVWGLENKKEHGNFEEAKVALENAKTVYNKYKDTYKDEQDIQDLKEAIKAVQKNVDICEEANAIKKKIESYKEVTYLSKEQAVDVLSIDNDGTFKHVAALDNLDRLIEGDTAFDGSRLLMIRYNELKELAEAAIKLDTPAAIVKEYAAKFNALNNAIPMTTVSVKDVKDLEKAILILNEYRIVAIAKANNVDTGIIPAVAEATADNANKLGLVDDAVGVYTAPYTDLDNALINDDNKDAISNADFTSFVKKLATVKDAYDKLYNDVNGIIDNIEKLYATDYDVDEAAIKTTEEAIEAYREAVAEFTYAEKVALDFYETPKLSDNLKDNAVEEMIKIIEKDVADKKLEIAAEKDLFAQEKAKEVAKIIRDKVTIIADKGSLTEADKANNKLAFEEIDELFKTPNVELIFRGLQTSAPTNVVVNYHKLLSSDFSSYAYGKEIVRYLTALSETEKDAVPEAASDVIKAIKELKVSEDMDANTKAFNAVYEKYDALTSDQKALVSNYSDFVNFAERSAILVAKAMEEKSVSLVDTTGTLTDDQVIICKDIKNILEANEDMLVVAGAYNEKGDSLEKMFKAPFTTKMTNYYNALSQLDRAERDFIIKNEIAPMYEAMVDGLHLEKDVTKENLAKVVVAIDKFNALSKEAQEILLVNKEGYAGKFEDGGAVAEADLKTLRKELNDPKADFNVGTLRDILSKEAKYKSLVLDYAKVEPIEDQVFAGEAVVVPADKIVVKDFAGNVVPADKYTVEFAQNEKAGVAEVIIKAKEDSNLIGMVKGTFNIVEDEKVPAPTGLKVIATDNGVLKIGVDAIEDIEGVTYKFFVRKIGNEKWVASKEKNENYVTFTGLTKNGEYDVKAVAIVNGEVSDETVMAGTVFANRIGNRSALMYKPVIKKVTINKGVAKVTVKTFDYNNIKYAVGFKKAGAKEYKWLQYTAKTVKTVKNLKKGVKYSFKIKYQYTSEVSGTIIKSTKWSNAVTKVAK